MRRNVALGLLHTLRRKNRMRRQIEIALKAAKFHGCKFVLHGKIQNLGEFPRRTSKSGECDGKPNGPTLLGESGRHSRHRKGLHETAARPVHD